jgi:hypothetical protein
MLEGGIREEVLVMFFAWLSRHAHKAHTSMMNAASVVSLQQRQDTIGASSDADKTVSVVGGDKKACC